ncbi:MAG TPA: alkaline phosphatase family protein [Clostridia bacterium]|nr:alkaline phosphatase family protein [Clostridia bacterium]
MCRRKNLILLTVFIMLFFIIGCVNEKDLTFKSAALITSNENLSTINASDDELLISNVIDLSNKNILMTYDGGYYDLEMDGFLVPSSSGIDFKNETGKEIYENVVGIINDPPKRSIMDVYHESKTFINRNEKVMVIYIDGWAWHQYEYLKANYQELYLSKFDNFEKALAVYKPVTNSGYAAMVTGQPPYKNGIINRNYREPKVETIFQVIEKKNKEIVLIEGNSNVINTGIDPILNLDINENGSNDDEVFKSAMKHIDSSDYLFLHFHGFDDAGHSYGPYGSKTMDKFFEIDHYIEELSSQWEGKIIVTTDHGMHATENGGSHGDFRYEDLIVPFGILEGGQN